jgi:signal transduction histidine kinase
MLSRTTLRTKLILLALVPLVAVFVLAGRSVRDDFAQASSAAAQAAEVQRASSINDIAGALERELLADRLIAPGVGEERNLVSPRRLDEAIAAFLLDPASAEEPTVTAVESFQQRLPALRAALDADALDTFEALVAARDALAADPDAALSAPDTPNLQSAALEWTAFTRVIDGLQDFDTSIFIDSATTEDALTLEMTAALREAVALQGASFSSLLTSDVVDAGLLVAAAEASASASRAQQDLLQFGSTDFIQLVQANGGAELTQRIAGAADEVLTQEVGEAPTTDVTTVRPAYLAADQLLIGAVDVLFGELNEAVNAAENEARQSAFTTLAVLAFLIVGMMLLVYALYRSIRRPLQRVTERSREVANVQLPGVVSSMRADVDAELPEIEPIRVTSKDEIGELVTAFNLMSSTALDLVGEQAVARRSIADMFMNLGRRNQKLLNRLLRNLDRLERDEEDPDVLEALYDIDHITTRMRRNAESLLVLAGAEQSRSFTQPATSGDVIRAALAEVEHYQRVSVTGDSSQLLTGESVADVAHLLAELLENALAFSPPETTVQLATRMTPRGYIFVVSDSGVGMSADKLAESNQRITMAASKEETPSKFLGLFVVGRLAARRGINVELFESPSGGVTARVTLPASALHDDRAEPPPISDVADAVPAPVTLPIPAPSSVPFDLPTRSSAVEDPPSPPPVPDSPVPLLVPPAVVSQPPLPPQPFAAPVKPAFAGAVPRTPNRPNRFGAPGRQPGAHLPRTLVEQPASDDPMGIDVDVVDHVQDAAAVKHSLSSFQSGTTQADQKSKIEETAGTP